MYVWLVSMRSFYAAVAKIALYIGDVCECTDTEYEYGDKLACRISTQLQSWNDKRSEAEAEAETEVGIAGVHALLLLVHLIFTSPISDLSAPGKW